VLTITPKHFALTCPAMVTTNAHGEAEFNCTTIAVLATTDTTIEVTDSFDRALPEPFHVKMVVNATKLPRPPRLTSESPVIGEVVTTVEDAIVIHVVEDISGLPVPGAGIEFTVPGDVTVTPRIAVTDLNGFANADITFGCRLETDTITATLNSTGLETTTVMHTSRRGPASRMARLQGTNQAGAPGELLPLALIARATDSCGNVTSGAPVTWEVLPPSAATLENAFAVTNVQGQASARVRIGNRAGPFTVRAITAGAAAVFSLRVNATAGSIVAIGGNNQAIPVGQPAAQTLVVELRDGSGGPLNATRVDFRVAQGSATLGSASAVSDEAGRASTTLVAGSQPGLLQVEARSGAAVFVFDLTVVGRTPVVTPAGFVNGASFAGGWVPGSTGTIFGTGLMEGIQGVILGSAPFTTTLRGVRVLVENIPAPILSLANVNGQQQINIQVPFGIPAPSTTVVVTIINNGTSATFSGVRTFAEQPGIFEITLPEGRFGAALHVNFSLVEPDNPSRSGSVLQLFWTGGGLTNPAVLTNQPGPIPPAVVSAAVTVLVNGVPAEVLGSFYAPTLVTAYQTNFRIPLGLTGSTVRVQLVINGAQSQEVLLPFQP
jgi:uncharacterized protein (TIGR03437 family)